jgi:CRISPR/Cas system-associated endoribonuclease Cas2
MTIRVKGLMVAMLGLVLLAAGAQAGNKWQQNHPRRAAVNKRLKNQNKRIQQGVKSGKLSKQQAQQLHKDDRQIRQEERDMAAQNGGHITKQEQQTLNQQENKVSQQIYSEKHEAPAPTTTPAPAQGQ